MTEVPWHCARPLKDCLRKWNSHSREPIQSLVTHFAPIRSEAVKRYEKGQIKCKPYLMKDNAIFIEITLSDAKD